MTTTDTARAALLHAWSADVYARRDVKPPEPILGPVLSRSTITLLTGPRGVGKSWLALALAHAAARGGSLAGWRAKPCRAVYLDAAGSEAVLHARLMALAPEAPSPNLVLVPGDAQERGLPDLADAAGREALDQIVIDADLLVVDGVAALVQLGRGVGARWAGLISWLRSLRRRGMAVLLIDNAEPRALAAIADTTLRLERPADGAAEADLRCLVRVIAARPAREQARRFELRLSLRKDGGSWTRLEDFDHRALVAWRLHQQEFSTREIGSKLGVSPATAWRLVERGEAMPAHLRDREELPELEAERRQAAAEDRAEKRRKRRRRARQLARAEEERLAEEAQEEEPHSTPLPNGEREGPAAEPREGEGESMSGVFGALLRAPLNRLALRARHLLPVREKVGIAHSPEAVKQPVSLDEVATDEMLAVFLERRRLAKRQVPPPPDRLSAFQYQDLSHALRNRLTGRVFNRKIAEDDANGAPPPRRSSLWDTPAALLPYEIVA